MMNIYQAIVMDDEHLPSYHHGWWTFYQAIVMDDEHLPSYRQWMMNIYQAIVSMVSWAW
jgi:hypothetical protein